MIHWIGNLHPLIVHLPIGFILLGFLFRLVDRFARTNFPSLMYLYIILFSALASTFAVVTGLIIADGAGYPSDVIQTHKISGIILAVATWISYFISRKNQEGKRLDWIFLILTILVTITGHFGGIITHGKDFLSMKKEVPYEKPVITDPNQAQIYQEVIEPIFADKCFSCHSERESKGDFRLDSPEFVMAGGEEGKAVIPKDAANSDLYQMITAPMDDDEHMPPEGKRQLSKEEIVLLQWWINEGCPFTGTTSEYHPNDSVEYALSTLVSDSITAVSLPDVDVKAPSKEAISDLNQAGFTVVPLSKESGFLSLSAFTSQITPESWKLLDPVAENIVWLRAIDQKISDPVWETIISCKNLTSLNVSDSEVSTDNMEALTKLNYLESLNLTQTKLPDDATSVISQMSQLKKIYLFGSNVDYEKIYEALPNVVIDTGHYQVPTLETDTTVKTAKPD